MIWLFASNAFSLGNIVPLTMHSERVSGFQVKDTPDTLASGNADNYPRGQDVPLITMNSFNSNMKIRQKFNTGHLPRVSISIQYSLTTALIFKK